MGMLLMSIKSNVAVCAKFIVFAVLFVLVASLGCFSISAWADESQDKAVQQEQTDQEQQSSIEDDSLSNEVYVNQLSDSSFLYETSIADLAEADSYYEGQTVLVKGEVVGDRVNDEFRENNCWITLQDNEASPSVVAVFMTKEQSSIIDTYGQYGTVGTQLQVRGTFHLECAEHQGMSDIHAEEVAALQKGYESKPAPSNRILSFGILACVIGAVLMVAYYIRRERML